MNKSYLLLPLTLLLTSSNSSLAKSYSTHELKARETLSELVYAKGLRPLYGKNGWVQRVMKLNRVDNKSSRQLDPGAIILFPKMLADQVNLAQSSTKSKNLSSGILYKASSKQFSIKIATGWSQKNQPLASENSQIFGLSVSLLEHKKLNMSLEADFSLQKSILISSQSNTYARFNPDFNFNIIKNFKSNQFEYGPFISLSENSFLENQSNSTKIRRDRNLSLGSYFSYKFYQNFTISASTKYPFYTQNLNNYESRRYQESILSFNTNLINNFGITLFSKFNTRKDKDEYASGLNLTKTFNQASIL